MSLINTTIKPFKAQAFHNGKFVEVTEATLKGKWSAFVFYPADFTFVCPTELGDLADLYCEFQKIGVEIYAVSTDTHFTHKAWADASDTIKKVKYPMLGDPTGNITRNFDVMIEEEGEDLVLPFPQDMLDEVGWKPGDNLEWVDQGDGTWEIRKKPMPLAPAGRRRRFRAPCGARRPGRDRLQFRPEPRLDHRTRNRINRTCRVRDCWLRAQGYDLEGYANSPDTTPPASPAKRR